MSLAAPGLCSEVVDGVTRIIVCLFREPDAGKLPVRFDEREQETAPSPTGLRRRRESFVSSHRTEWAQVKLLQGSLITVGWISTKHLDSGQGRTFFLTSLLIELIDTEKGEEKAHTCANA